MPDPSRRTLAARAWISRTLGALILGEQAVSHVLADREPSTLLVGVGLFLLVRREAADFLRLLLGRD